MKKFFDPSMLRFLLVGVVNTLVGAGIMFLLYNLAGCSYWLSSVVKNLPLGRYQKQVLRFALNVAVCWLLAYGIAKPLALRLLAGFDEKLQTNAAMLAGLCLYTALNYLGQRFFAFRAKED